MANEIYPVSWWGSPVKNGWGSIYYDYAETLSPTVSQYRQRVLDDGGIIEAIECVESNLNL
tara:strand:- start:865 stop:1047 length:183 start_codon:yes stop_codon:yes gene_type:complete